MKAIFLFDESAAFETDTPNCSTRESPNVVFPNPENVYESLFQSPWILRCNGFRVRVRVRVSVSISVSVSVTDRVRGCESKQKEKKTRNQQRT